MRLSARHNKCVDLSRNIIKEHKYKGLLKKNKGL
jgi:hypothetical protein